MANQQLDLWSLEGAVERVRLLTDLARNATRQTFDPLASIYVGRAVQGSYLHAAALDFPLYYWCVYGDQLLVLLMGISNRAQGEAVQYGYTDRGGQGAYSGANGYFYDYARAVKTSMAGLGVPPAGITIIGHSAGGAAAWWLSRLLQDEWNTTALTKVVTFGSPKTVTRDTTTNYNLFFHTTSCAWALFDDPIPLLPPQSLTWTFRYGTGWLGGQLARVRSFIAPQVGKVVQGNLSVSDGVVPLGVDFPSTLDFAAWYWVLGAQPENAHALETYRTRLVNAQALASIQQAQPIPAPVPPVTPVPTPMEVRRAFAAERAAYVTSEREQNTQIPSYPEGANFIVEHQAGTWKVSFGGVIVAVGPGRKTAQGLAATGNSLIRRLQRQGGVDTAQLAEQFVSFLALATEGDSGYAPTLAQIK